MYKRHENAINAYPIDIIMNFHSKKYITYKVNQWRFFAQHKMSLNSLELINYFIEKRIIKNYQSNLMTIELAVIFVRIIDNAIFNIFFR